MVRHKLSVMFRPLCSLGGILVGYFLFLASNTATSVSVARPSGGRRGRQLTFPYGGDESYLEFIFGIGVPLDLPHPYSVTMTFEIRADWLYPTNASDFLEPNLRAELKDAAAAAGGGAERKVEKRSLEPPTSRWNIYELLEAATSRIGMDGRACLLRSICDAAATPLDHRGNGLIGQLMHVILTPSSTDEDRGRYLDDEYRAAERIGANGENACNLYYPECDVSLLDVISKLAS